MWNLRALEAANAISDERAAQAGAISPVAGFYPSLHLNLAECYRKLGDLDRAQERLHHGRNTIVALSDGAYGQQIRDFFVEVEEWLSSA